MKDFNSADFERLKDIYYAEAYNLAFALLGESDSAAKITELSLSDAAKYSYNERKFHKKLVKKTLCYCRAHISPHRKISNFLWYTALVLITCAVIFIACIPLLVYKTTDFREPSRDLFAAVSLFLENDEEGL